MNRLILSLAVLVCGTSYAEVKMYDVEIVLFEDVSQKYINSEIWPKLNSNPEHYTGHPTEPSAELSVEHSENTHNLIETSSADSVTAPVIDTEGTMLSFPGEQADLFEHEADYPTENFVINILDIQPNLLNEEVNKIDQSRNYNVLLHRSWRQTGLSSAQVISIPINSKNITPVSTEDHNPLSDIETLDHKITPSTPYVNGNIKIELSRYLHVYADLIYNVPENQLLPTATDYLDDEKFAKYHFNAHRKLRSNELHYIDHSLIGMLIKIIPTDVVIENAIQQENTDDATLKLNNI